MQTPEVRIPQNDEEASKLILQGYAVPKEWVDRWLTPSMATLNQALYQ